MTRDRGIPIRAAGTAALVAVLVVGLSVWAGPAGAAFPDQNGRVVFESRKPATGGGIENAVLAVEPDGSGYVRLAEGGSDPAVSPDGPKIAFARGGDIWVMATDGSARSRLTGGEASDSGPAWSPDGRRIAFVGATHGIDSEGYDSVRESIFLMNPDGSGQAELAGASGYPGYAPSVGPPTGRPTARRSPSTWLGTGRTPGA